MLAVLFVPRLVPVPPMADVQPAAEPAEPDSRFLELEGLAVHVKTAGAGRRAVALLPGFGASLFYGHPKHNQPGGVLMKNALLWGASGGIGRAVLDLLWEEGWSVYAVARRVDAMPGFVAGRFAADFSDPSSVERATSEIGQRSSEFALWLYTAGDIVSAKVNDLEPAVWRRILDANLDGAYLACHYSLPLLAADAHLVFFGALSEKLRLPGLAAYATAKAGIEAFVEVLRKEQRGKRVTLVRPAAVTTALWGKVPFRLPAGALSPEEVAVRVLQAHYDGHQGTLDL